MMSPKFKLGDKVRVVKYIQTVSASEHLHQLGTVIKVGNTLCYTDNDKLFAKKVGYYYYVLDIEGCDPEFAGGIYENELELIPFYVNLEKLINE